ncbi:MAG: class I tRNA ligase family protein [Candidatus Marinimicrobia bacterium]|nr:class I tRNA ligase family protein [Candidatus Neomarinimicrobiota bacterium]
MNKLWNASRFVFMNMEEAPDGLPDKAQPELPDRWILSRLKETIRKVDRLLEHYRFNDAAKEIYEFTWSAFCDWYIELIKGRLYGKDPAKKAAALGTAVFVLRNILKLLHPFAPFITEEIWQSLKNADEPDIMIAEWPSPAALPHDGLALKEMELLMRCTTAIRTIRAEMKVPPSRKADVLIRGGSAEERTLLEDLRQELTALAGIANLDIRGKAEKPQPSSSAVVGGLEIDVLLAGLIDIAKERERLKKEILAYEGRIRSGESKLNNPDFVRRAPEDVVKHERNKLRNYQESLQLLQDNLQKLGNG